MENICIVCQTLAEVGCSCDDSVRLCYKHFIEVHKSTKGTHESIELPIKKPIDEKLFSESSIKTHSTFNKETIIPDLNKLLNKKIQNSLNYSKNIQKMEKKIQSSLNLFIEGHKSFIQSIALTSDDKYVISGSGDEITRDFTIRI